MARFDTLDQAPGDDVRMAGCPDGAVRVEALHRASSKDEILVPQRVSKALRFGLAGLYSARREDHRIIYRIDERVTITAIEHRADVYR